ncbi:hypothetical protein BC831DRAFT_232234 [Entophlyctis helioformis]|nr:hypothetical protein BC831DRAFT_232234 [Entophlyctis helioformis]
MVRGDDTDLIAVEMKAPKSVSVEPPLLEPTNLLSLIVNQARSCDKEVREMRNGNGHKTAESIRASVCRAAACLLQLLGYLKDSRARCGVLSTFKHSWFVKHGAAIDDKQVFFVSKSVPFNAKSPVTLRQALFCAMSDDKFLAVVDASLPPAPGPAPGPATGPAPGPTTGPAPGQADAPPASGPASGSASGSAPEPSRRDGYATYGNFTVDIRELDAQLCPCSSGGRTLVANDSGVNLMHSPKPTLHLHGVIGRGRTGTVWIGCLDGERVAVKQVVLHDLDDTNYRKIRREVLFYGKCKDLWGDAIPDVKEAILSRHHAFLVMELGQPCMAWEDQDRRLAEQALNKLHARRILHRDLHSGNVVFVGEGDERKARIVDLESARFEHGWDFEELAAKEKARVARFGTPTEYDRRHVE